MIDTSTLRKKLEEAGWAIVKIEPTIDMKRAGVRCSDMYYLNHAADVWVEMMANSPIPSVDELNDIFDEAKS